MGRAILCCARASSARLPRWSTGGLELLLRWFACAAAALAVGGAALVAMRPALKTGQLKLGAGAARQPSPLARTRGSSLRSCAAAAKETQRCAGMLLAVVAAAAPTNPPSPSVPCDASVAPAFPRWVSQPERARSVRGVNLTCPIVSFCLCLLLFWRCSQSAPRTRAVLQIQTRTLASV